MFTLVGSCAGGRGARVGDWHGQRYMLVCFLETSESLTQFQSASSSWFLGVRKMSVHFTSGSGFLTALYKFHWFSNQLMALIFPMSDSRAGVSNMWFELLTPQGGSPNPDSSVSPLMGCESWTDLFSSLPTQFCVYLSYNLGCTRGFLPVSKLFLVRIVPRVDMFLMCFWGGGVISILIFHHHLCLLPLYYFT